MTDVVLSPTEQAVGHFFDLPHLRRGFAARWPDRPLPEELRGDVAMAQRAFLAHGSKWDIDPTPTFDRAYYLECNPDIAAAGVDPFSHFLKYGLSEGRAFHPEISLPSGLDGPVHLAAIGDALERGSYRFGPVPGDCDARLTLSGRLLSAAGGNWAAMGRLVELLAQLIDDEVAGLAYPELNGWALVAHLAAGERALPVPGSQFGGPIGTVGTEASRGLAEAAFETATDIPRCWSPGPRMNMRYYEMLNADLALWTHDLLTHFLAHGQFEWRRASAMIDHDRLRWQSPESAAMPAMKALQLAALRGEKLRPNGSCLSPVELVEMMDGQVDVFAALDILANSYDEMLVANGFAATEAPVHRQIRAAAALDPQIGVVQPMRTLLPKPFDLPLLPAAAACRRGIGPCDLIVLRDHISMGGADRVTGAAIRALKARVPGLKLTVLSTMAGGLGEERAHYPDGTRIFDLGAFSQSLDEIQMQELLYDVIAGSGCRTVLNVNSRLGWETTLAFGRQLCRNTRLVGYMFCDDRDEWGNVDGYPSRYFLPAMEHLDALITDTDDLRQSLCDRVAGAAKLSERLHWLRTPFAQDTAKPVPPRRENAPIRVVWAGRFDRQKRFGLMVETARKMPDTEFLVWGKPVLGDYRFEPDTLPDNIRLMGSYDDFSEITAMAPAVFLYTSLWDGAPTILLDAMAWGMPIVATDVGGVRECLPLDHPYLIDAEAGASAYCTAIEALAAQDQAQHEAMQSLYRTALADRDTTSYGSALQRILLS